MRTQGAMDVSSTSTSFHNNSYASKYQFYRTDTISLQYGRTEIQLTSSFSLSKNNDTLFKESNIFIWNDYP